MRTNRQAYGGDEGDLKCFWMLVFCVVLVESIWASYAGFKFGDFSEAALLIGIPLGFGFFLGNARAIRAIATSGTTWRSGWHFPSW